jgi:sugar transferase (PEP-CTERM/EpsH1 system associated)
MKLLILTPQLPYPPHQGTTIRNFNIIQCLAERHDISLLSFGTPGERAGAKPLQAACRRIEIVSYPTRSTARRALTTFTSPLPDMALRLKSEAMHSKFQELLQHESFDLVQIEGIEMARYWTMSRAAKSMAGKPKLVFDDHNAEYVLQRTAFESDARDVRRWHGALYSFIQWKKLTRFERDICEMADAVVACSPTDANAITALTGDASKTQTIPNGVDTTHFVPSDRVCAKPLAEVAMVFAGKMDFRPNIDAMSWFCGEILPAIRVEVPLAHIVIVGQKPSSRIVALGKQEGVSVTGWVPDTRPYISDGAVYVVPLRMGSGTRLKVLEAMAMGKAIVSTSRGVEGIDVTREREVVIADSPSEFASAVVGLLRDPQRRQELGCAARALAEAKYDWRALVPAFDRVYQDVS